MRKICVTGGIGSGKSTICKILEEFGYKIYYSDQYAIYLAENNNKLKFKIIKEFGIKSFLINGIYNRNYISSIVFKDKSKLNILNNLFVEYLKNDFEQYCIENKDENVIFYESALVFEHNKQDEFDSIICVYCDKNKVIERLKIRNGFTDEQINDRLNSQMDVELKKSKSDYIIDTSNGIDSEQLKEIINKIS